MDLLIVDHEPYRSQSLAHGLRIMGYSVFEAGTLSGAVQFVTHPDLSIYLIITDCSTRILYHPELIEAISENLHDIQCVMMTDNANWNAETPAAWLWPIHFIQKPITTMQLVYLISKLRRQSLQIAIPQLTNRMSDRMESNPSTSLAHRAHC